MDIDVKPNLDPKYNYRRMKRLLKHVWTHFQEDRCLDEAASLSYTSLLSLVPLLAVVFGIVAAFPVFNEWADRLQTIIIESFMPSTGAQIAPYLNTFLDSVSNLTLPGMLTLIVTALLLLTCVVWVWMYLTRIPAVKKAGMQLDSNLPKGQQMAELPAKVRWKADNYNHLLEQPTLFYAVALTLALLGAGEGLNVTLAWCYVGLRVVHSIQQTLWNKIEVRFVLFFLSSLVLVTLVLRAAMLVWMQ